MKTKQVTTVRMMRMIGIRLWRTKKPIISLAIVVFCIISFGIHYLPSYSTNTFPTRSHVLPKRNCYQGHELHRIYNPSTTFSEGTNFPIIMPHVEPKISDKNLYVVVVANSGSHDGVHRLLRRAIRQTWGNWRNDIENDCTIKWRMFFSLGMSNDANSDKNNRLEAQEHNDIIIGDFKDTYKNIPVKTFMAHWWVFNRFSCQYVLKTDDDVYVRVSKLLHWLLNAGSPGWFYGGLQHSTLYIDRDPHSKWYITREQFNESSWPPFAHGAFHVLSTDVLPAFFYYTQLRKPFHTDDAYIGVAARDLGIHLTKLHGFTLWMPKNNCRFNDTVAIGHAISAAKMIEVHKTYESLALKKNLTCHTG